MPMPAAYNGGLTREQFLFYETRTVAGLWVEGLSQPEILTRVRAQNLFQFPTERTVKSIALACLGRLRALPQPDLIAQLATAPVGEAKLVNLYAMMCQNRIVWDFMVEVVGEKYRMGDATYTRADADGYLFRLQQRLPAATGWSDATLNKIRQVLTHCLVECGYLSSPRATALLPVWAPPALEAALRAVGDTAALPAFCCLA